MSRSKKSAIQDDNTEVADAALKLYNARNTARMAAAAALHAAAVADSTVTAAVRASMDAASRTADVAAAERAREAWLRAEDEIEQARRAAHKAFGTADAHHTAALKNRTVAPDRPRHKGAQAPPVADDPA